MFRLARAWQDGASWGDLFGLVLYDVILIAIFTYAAVTDLSSTPAGNYMMMHWPRWPSEAGMYAPLSYGMEFVGRNPMLVGGLICVIAVIVARVDSNMPMLEELMRVLGWGAMLVAFLPILLAILTTYFGVQLFDPVCTEPQMMDVTRLVLDNVARGALVHFMETFNIEFYRCPPVKHYWVTSGILFAIRIFSTYVMLWALMMIWKIAKERFDKLSAT